MIKKIIIDITNYIFEEYKSGDKFITELTLFKRFVINNYKNITKEEFEILDKELDEINNKEIFLPICNYYCGTYIDNFIISRFEKYTYELIENSFNNEYYLRFIIKFIYKFYSLNTLYYLLEFSYKYVKENHIFRYNEDIYVYEFYKKLILDKFLFEIISEKELLIIHFESKLTGNGKLTQAIDNILELMENEVI